MGAVTNGIAGVAGAFFLGMSSFTFAESDDLLYLSQMQRNISAANQTNLKQDKGEVDLNLFDQFLEAYSGLLSSVNMPHSGVVWGDPEYEYEYVTTTTGAGLNLLLINEIDENRDAVAGYVKEYLTIAGEEYDGTLWADPKDDPDYGRSAENLSTYGTRRMTVSALIATNFRESGSYNDGAIGKYLPNTDLPDKTDPNGKGKIPDWRGFGSEYSLGNWGNNQSVHHSLGSDGEVGGPFHHNPDTYTWSALYIKSKYNKGSHTPGGTADGYLLGDAIANYAARKTPLKNTDTLKGSTFASYVFGSHMRGFLGFMGEMVGVCFHDGATSNYVKQSSLEKLDTDILEKHMSLIDSALDYSKLDAKTAYNVGRSTYHCYSMIPYLAHGWYLNGQNINNFFDSFKDDERGKAALKYWNTYKPDEAVSSVAELKTLIKNNYVKTYKEILQMNGYSNLADRCDAIYGSVNGNYYRCYNSYHYGIVKFTGETGTFFEKNKGEKVPLFIGLDIIVAAGFAEARMCGDYHYAKMLQVAGLDGVDPTNPQTYLTSVGQTQTTVIKRLKNGDNEDANSELNPNDSTWLPKAESGSVWEYLDDHDVNYSAVKGHSNNAKIVELGFQYTLEHLGLTVQEAKDASPKRGGIYVRGGNSLTNGIDCSGYAYELYKKIGFDIGIRYSNSFKAVKASDKWAVYGPGEYSNGIPGDIWGCDGHVLIYVGYKEVNGEKKYQFEEAIGKDYGIRILHRSIDEKGIDGHGNAYHCLHYKKLDQ